MRRLAIALGMAALLAAPVNAQKRDEREANVGMRARIEQLVLPGPELIAKPVDDPKAPILLRVVATWPHGDAFRYDLEYTGFVAGRHDLREWFVRADGSPAEGLPEIQVKITSVLTPLSIRPHELEPVEPPAVGGYRSLLVAAGIAWLIGLGALLFFRRRRAAAIADATVPPPTLADRLRPMVEAALHGRLDDARRAELERLLLAHWRERLALREMRTAQAIATLREHDEAGALLRQLEQWLHAPPSDAARADVDVQRLLAPYRDVHDPLDGASR